MKSVSRAGNGSTQGVTGRAHDRDAWQAGVSRDRGVWQAGQPQRLPSAWGFTPTLTPLPHFCLSPSCILCLLLSLHKVAQRPKGNHFALCCGATGSCGNFLSTLMVNIYVCFLWEELD